MKCQYLRVIICKFLLSLAVTVLIIANFTGSAYSIDGLTGPAFSDPAQIMDMSESWKKQPFKYDPNNLAGLVSGKYPLYRVYTFTTWRFNGNELVGVPE